MTETLDDMILDDEYLQFVEVHKDSAMNYVFLNPDGTISLGLLVIIESKTNVAYRTQCAGTGTYIREMEGFLIPVGDQAMAAIIYDWFWENLHGTDSGISNDLIDQLRQLVSEIPYFFETADGSCERLFLELDESRIDECVEAWIPVKTRYGKGILTLDNSD